MEIEVKGLLIADLLRAFDRVVLLVVKAVASGKRFPLRPLPKVELMARCAQKIAIACNSKLITHNCLAAARVRGFVA